eukprot:TRINITY_DN2015_c0_g2_i2.p1 TRINITY_DN2015_c0_g2~~TRINITY_DN2015_c0_g2_i2.p1  ORF type:complete len:1301 (-),score=132.12 TRINITY_DN2015_c0_g2_i2:1119-4610(-)
MKNKEAVINGFLMVGLNYDSNVYADTGETQFGVPLFNINVTGNKEKEDYYNSNVIGVNHIKDIGEVGSWVWKSTGLLLNNNYRRYTDKNLFGLGITTGPSYFGKDYELYFPFSATKIWQGGKQYVNDISQGARWTRKVDQTFIFSAGYKYSRVFYENPNTDKDYMQHAFTLSATKFFTKKWNIALGAKLANSKGTRLKVATEGNTGNSETEGSINTTYQATDKLSFTAGALFRNQNYNEIDVFFGNTREDRYQSYSLSSLYSITDSSSIKASVADIQNHSNHGPYDYDKTTAGINYIMTFQGVAMKSVKNLLLIALLFAPLALHASIAKFSALSGDVSIIESGKSSPATMSSVIDKKDKIVTGESGKAQIVFKDNTVITLGINSDFAIEEYFSDAKKPKASFSIGKGTFKALTGAMGKINPDGFKLKTKTATIGIRGTGILGQVTPTENNLACTQGAITVTSVTTGDTVEVPAGSITTVTPNTPPTPPRAYTPEETGAIESESGVNEMPSDTQTQEESGGVEGGEAGATEAAAEGEANAEDERATNEGDTAEETATEETATDEEGEVTTAEADTEANTETATTEDTIATTEDDVALPATTEALPEATDIGVIDSVVTDGVTNVDQTNNFINEVESSMVSMDEATTNGSGEDGGTTDSGGSSGETYNYADDRDEYLFGMLGIGEENSLNMLNIDPSDTSMNSILLKGYEFAITTSSPMPPYEESISKFSFPRTPVADSYVGSDHATIGTYGASDSAKLNEIFGAPMEPDSAWISGFEKVYFDTMQEFFVYEASGIYDDGQGSERTMEKFATIGKKAKWADKPNYVAHYSNVLDGGSKDTIINFHNNTLLYLDTDTGRLLIGEISEDSASGAIKISGSEEMSEMINGGYLFGSEFQGYGVELHYGGDFPHGMQAGYKKQTYTPQTFVGTLEGFRATTGSVVELDMDIDSESLLGQPIERLEIDNDGINMVNVWDRSAYMNNGLFATSADYNYLVTDMSDEYNSWGYWASADMTSSTIEPGANRGYWIAGDIEDLIIPSSGTYNYKATDGNIQGHFADGSSYETITSGTIDLSIDFSGGSVGVNQFKISSSSYSWDMSDVGSGGSIDVATGAFDGNMIDTANSASGVFKGQLYGDAAQRAAGAFRASQTPSGVAARGVFRADNYQI